MTPDATYYRKCLTIIVPFWCGLMYLFFGRVACQDLLLPSTSLGEKSAL